MLDLTRFGSPHYTAFVPPQGPIGDKLAMAFANEGLGGPAFPAVYSRSTSLSMIEQGYALETWVSAGPTDLDQIRNNLIAYNGDPASNGFGFFLHGENYVARVGAFERSAWASHQLASGIIWHTFNRLARSIITTTVSWSQKRRPIHLPTAATGGFWLGGLGDPLSDGSFLFNGWIDEVRYQSFNPLTAGAFDPTAFLITPVPEPATIALATVGFLMAGALLWRKRWAA